MEDVRNLLVKEIESRGIKVLEIRDKEIVVEGKEGKKETVRLMAIEEIQGLHRLGDTDIAEIFADLVEEFINFVPEEKK
jgi:hypothetical protein